MEKEKFKETECSICGEKYNRYSGIFQNGEPVCPVCAYSDYDLYTTGGSSIILENKAEEEE